MPKVYTDMDQLNILWRTLPSQPKVSYQCWCLQQGCTISVGMNVAFSVLLSFCVGLSMPLNILIFAKTVLKLFRVCSPWYCWQVVCQSRYIYNDALSMSLFTCKVAHALWTLLFILELWPFFHITIVCSHWVDPTWNAYNSWTTDVTNAKLGRLAAIHNLAIILESCDCKPLVAKLVNVLHTLVWAP